MSHRRTAPLGKTLFSVTKSLSAIVPRQNSTAPGPGAVTEIIFSTAPGSGAVAPRPNSVAPGLGAVAPEPNLVASRSGAVAPRPTLVAPGPVAVTEIISAVEKTQNSGAETLFPSRKTLSSVPPPPHRRQPSLRATRKREPLPVWQGGFPPRTFEKLRPLEPPFRVRSTFLGYAST